MGRIRGTLARLRAMLGRRATARRFDDELRFHLDMETEKNVRLGHPPADARRLARRAFGSVEQHRAAMGVPAAHWRDEVRDDVRYAWRTLRRSPGFAVAAALTLGVGVGMNGLVFGFVDGLILRPIPASHPERLVALYELDRRDGQPNSLGYEDYLDFRDRSGIFAGVAAFTGVPLNLSAGTAADMVWGEMVTANYFSVLAMRPALGRFFTAADSLPGASPVGVVSYESWRRRFAGDPAIVGRTVRINGTLFTIVGVAPAGFKGMRTFGFWPEVWAPAAMHDVLVPGSSGMMSGRGGGWATTFARLRDGWSVPRTEAAATVFARRLAQSFPESNRDVGVLFLPARTGFDNPAFVPPRILTLASSLAIFAVSLVLLVVCANLANLLLARAAARQRELAIRLSLGCSRRRLVRQLLVEAGVLALPGAALGAAIVLAGPTIEAAMVPHLQFRVGLGSMVDHRVLLYTAGVALLAVVLFGLAPALRASRPSLVPALKAAIGRRAGAEPGASLAGRLGMRATLVVVQLALSVVLLTAGTLFARSLRAAQAVDVGFDPRGRVLVSVNPGLQGYDEARGRAFYRDVLARARAMPEVIDASWGFPLPFDTYNRGLSLYVEGAARTPHDQTVMVSSSAVEDRFFAAMGLPIVAGRALVPSDSAGAPLRMVVSRAMAARFWPGREAVGQRARLGGANGPEITVVGVAADAKFNSMSEAPHAHVYVPLAQHLRTERYRAWQTLVVHTRAAPDAAIRQLQGVVAAVDPTLPTFGAMTMAQGVSNALNAGEAAASVAGVVGIAALLIASVGLYALVAHLVVERAREIGVRIALGATPARVRRLVIGRAGRLGALGLVLGLVGAAAVARLLRGLLYGISPHDPATFALVPLVLGAVVVAASFVPAWRATRLDPATALRE